MAETLTLEGVLGAHVLVGGTYWDHERKTTFARCHCGAECYLVDQPDDFATHVADAVRAWLLGQREAIAGELSYLSGDYRGREHEWLDEADAVLGALTKADQ